MTFAFDTRWHSLLRYAAALLMSVALSIDTSAAANQTLETQVRQFARESLPGFQQSTPVVLDEYPVAGLWEQSRARVYLARLLGSGGKQFNELLFIHYNDTITSLGNTFGGHGLMSAVMFERHLHYTISSGAGIHRSQLGVVSFSRGQAKVEQSQGVPNVDLFVRAEGESAIVESGQYVEFNVWRDAKRRGAFEQAWTAANRITPAVQESSESTNTTPAVATTIPSTVDDPALQAWIWNNWVPKSGQSPSLQGELLRIVQKLRVEAQANGNINWDDGFVRFVEFLQRHLLAETRFDEQTRTQLTADLDRLSGFRLFDDIQEHVRNNELPPAGRAYIANDLYDRLVARVVEYSRLHPELIPLQPDPAQYR